MPQEHFSREVDRLRRLIEGFPNFRLRRDVFVSSASQQALVPYASGHLIDGGITSLVPVRFARAMGADIVIAVDIYCQGSRGSGIGAPAMLHRAMHMQSCLLAAPEMAEADVLIAPAVEMTGLTGPESRKAAIEAGYLAARAALARFKSRSVEPKKTAQRVA